MQELFHDYNLILQMKVDIKKKVRILSELMTATDNFWRVVGITEEALILFKKNDFKKAKGVHRSHHLMARHKFYTNSILNPVVDYHKWWQDFKDFDKTILATSGENGKNLYSKIFAIDESLGLFKSYGYSWKHNKEEVSFLTNLHLKHFDS